MWERQADRQTHHRSSNPLLTYGYNSAVLKPLAVSDNSFGCSPGSKQCVSGQGCPETQFVTDQKVIIPAIVLVPVSPP